VRGMRQLKKFAVRCHEIFGSAFAENKLLPEVNPTTSIEGVQREALAKDGSRCVPGEDSGDYRTNFVLWARCDLMDRQRF
jgi:hypothetical protein